MAKKTAKTTAPKTVHKAAKRAPKSAAKKPASLEINYARQRTIVPKTSKLDSPTTQAESARLHAENTQLPIEALPHYLFALASEVSKRWHKNNKLSGVLIVIGHFAKGKECRARGMRQLGKNSLAGRHLQADSPEFAEMLDRSDDAFGDGAIVIDATGQVLGAGAYIVVDHPEARIPKESGSRHLAAASVSLRPDIVASVTISEETGRVRMFENGRETSLFNPEKQKRPGTPASVPKTPGPAPGASASE